jgi:hypothetical protein
LLLGVAVVEDEDTFVFCVKADNQRIYFLLLLIIFLVERIMVLLPRDHSQVVNDRVFLFESNHAVR